MDPILRSDLRVANAVREQLLLLRRRSLVSSPEGTGRVVDKMHEMLKAYRKVELAGTQRLPRSRLQLKQKWDVTLQDLACSIRVLAQPVEPVPNEVRPLQDLLDDLAKIRQDFGEYEFFRDEPMLAVSTPAITLKGLDLGRFRIELNVLPLGRRTNKNIYELRTLDLKCAASNGGVSHPHVLYGHLNAREFTEPIRDAKMAGRIADLFHLIVAALETYDPTTAYVKIDDWHKVFCNQCHQELPEGLRMFCEGCDEWCCQRCRLECPDCGKHVCQDCQSICPLCGKILCHTCITTCATCGASACQSCLQGGLCPGCAAEWAKPA